jgi:hypothetical protein
MNGYFIVNIQFAVAPVSLLILKNYMHSGLAIRMPVTGIL